MNEDVNKANEIFRRALDLLPEARADFLGNVCGDDAELRSRVEELLADHERQSKIAVANNPTLPLVETERMDPAESVGAVIDRYKLLQEIGEGGCGVVYMAEQEQPVRRRVALKIVKLGMDTKQVVARFEAERQVLALMDHPNIAKVLDAGSTKSGRPFFVMELVRGIKVTEFCDQHKLSTRQRLELFLQICSAIQHAHQKGIIHRDLKPSNVLVTLHDGVPVPKVIDFGIAKATTHQQLTNKTLFTAFDQFMGTPAYMSPEQAEMSGLDVDTRSDIYSLGVLLYELLTGRTPFDPHELLRSGIDGFRKTLREQEPVKPSTRLNTLADADLTSVAVARHVEPPRLVHAVRGDLDWVVMKCLEKDRTRRYETANGLAMDIRRHLANEPVVARPPSTSYRLQKMIRRNKVVFAAGTAIAASLVIGIVMSARQAVRATEAEKLATVRLNQVAAERDEKERARADAEIISTFLIDVFRSPDPTRDGRAITVAETLDRAAQKLKTDLTTQPDRRTKLEATLGHTYYALGIYREAIQLQEKVRDYYRTTSGPTHPDTLHAISDLAFSYYAAGRRPEALKLREELLAQYQKANIPESPDTLWTMHCLADSYYAAGRQAEALKLREQVLATRLKISGPDDPITLDDKGNLAISYQMAGRQNEALKLREEVLAARRKILSPEHPEVLWAMHGLADSYSAVGRQDEALKLREDVLAARRKINGPEHPATLIAMSYVAYSYQAADRLDEALKLREDVLALRRKLNGTKHPDTLSAMGDLAESYRRFGRLDEAIKLREEELTQRRVVNGLEHPATLSTMNALAQTYQAAGREDAAFKLREELLPLRRKVSGPQHSETQQLIRTLADAYVSKNRTAEGLALLVEASTYKPSDTSLAMKVAALQVWLGQDAEYATTSQRMLQSVTNTSNAVDVEHIARLACLRPIADESRQTAVVALAKHAVELSANDKTSLAWSQLTLGMAEYRARHFNEADAALNAVTEGADSSKSYHALIEITASFYRATSLLQQGKSVEAREAFASAESKMRPLPTDDKNPLIANGVTTEDLILWLACKEARALFAVAAK